MATRLTIDPITRIEGHLRVDVRVADGRVHDAWASCTMWRGIETILRGREAREAWLIAQRFCGVCTTVHGLASVRAVEDALQLRIPDNAQYIRNLILIAHALHDHIVHFYHLSALDWVDVTTVPKATAHRAAALAGSYSAWTGNGAAALQEVKDRVQGVLDSGQLGIFSHGYWGHPAMRLRPEENLVALTHYFQALEVQRKAAQIVAILGGKSPHIQNLAVGGVMNAINLDSPTALNGQRLAQVRSLFADLVTFVREVYLPDVALIGARYPEWFAIGRGVDHYLAAPDLPVDGANAAFDLPGGLIVDGDLAGVVPFHGFADERFRRGVVEDVTRAWYEGSGAQHPYEGETEPRFTGWQEDGKYTWVKAPRFEGRPMQVGPVADVLVGYATGHALTRKWTDHALGRASSLAGTRIGVDALRSTMGRHLARAVRAGMLAELADVNWTRLETNVASGDTRTYTHRNPPKGEISGVGVHAAPRGILSHWMVIEDGKVKNYQAVVPTTWNASPRDAQGVRGPYEASLIDTPVADEHLPLEVIRTIHSFDPCMACACHAHDPEGREVARVRVL